MTVTTERPRIGTNGSGRPSASRVVRTRQRNVPLGVIGVLIVLGSALGGLLWSRTTVSRTDVLVAAHDIPAGRQLSDSDVRVVRLSADGSVASIPATQRATVIGQMVSVPIPAGALLAPSEIGRDTGLADNEAVVGVVLAPGAAPTADLRSGDRVAVIEADKSTSTTSTSASGTAVVTTASVYAIDRLGSSNGLFVSLRVPASVAARVAAAAAGDRVRLVLLPPGATLPGTGG
jgi:Flp pilus assembly protein CpaB